MTTKPNGDRPTAPEPAWARTVRHMILTWFGCGLSPVAPGTVASLGALPLAAVIDWLLGPTALVIGAMVIFLVGWAVAHTDLGTTPGVEDPQWIVIDEVAGQWLALAAVPMHVAGYALAFGLFRAFDIAKPWPVRWADRHIPGALGIMLDDLLAGLYAAVAAFLVLRLIRLF